jgi:hypoxanthine phosphoribosyltransferase
MDILGALFTWDFAKIAVTAVSVVVSVVLYLKNKKLSRERISFRWADVHAGANDIARYFRKQSFEPELLLTLSVRGATIAGVTSLEYDGCMPIYLCVQEDVAAPFPNPPTDHTVVETAKWRTHIPNALKSHSAQRILVIDDFVASGDSLQLVRAKLQEFGFQKTRIKTATLVCTTTAIQTKKAPDYYCQEVPTPNFRFPWGRAK